MNAYQVSQVLKKVKDALVDTNYLLELFMRNDKEHTLHEALSNDGVKRSTTSGMVSPPLKEDHKPHVVGD